MRRALYILAHLDEADIGWLVETGTIRRVAAGETLIAEGAQVDQIFVVIDGHLSVSVRGGKIVAELQTGDIVGEMSLIEKRPPSATVSANSPCRLLAVPQAALRRRLAVDAPFAVRFYHALASLLSDRLRNTMAIMERNTAGDQSDRANYERENELDESLLDTLHIAGEKFKRMIALLDGRG